MRLPADFHGKARMVFGDKTRLWGLCMTVLWPQFSWGWHEWPFLKDCKLGDRYLAPCIGKHFILEQIKKLEEIVDAAASPEELADRLAREVKTL